MNLPKQLQDQSDLADKAIAEFQARQAAAAAAPVSAPAPAPAAPTQEGDGAPPAPVETDVVDDSSQGSESGHDAPPAPDQAGAGKRVDYKAQYFTLQGLYKAANIPGLQQTLRTQAARIAELEAQLKSSVPGATEGAAPAKKQKLSESLRAALGDEVASELENVLAGQDQSFREALKPVSERAEAADKAQVQQQHNAFLTALGKEVEDWAEIDVMPEWNLFLNGVHPEAGVPRQALLERAFATGNVAIAAAQFKAFKKLMGIPDKSAAPAAPAARTPAPAALQRQVTPAPSGKAPVVTPEKKIWTKAEILECGKRIALGKITGQLAADLEADFSAAGAEGRIRG